MILPKGYERAEFPDMALVLKEDAVSRAGDLRDLLRAILDGRKEEWDLDAVAAGRGTVYIATLPGVGEIVVRVYRHGGILGGVLGTYFPTCHRFLNELVVTEAARALGVTRLESVGVACLGTAPGVRGFWISRRLKGTESLYAYMASRPPGTTLVARIAFTVARMHEGGIFHADLNIQNILVTFEGEVPEVSIIDFDKAFRKPRLGPEARVRQLLRLDRSLLKCLPEDSPWRSPWVRLRFAAAYSKVFPEVRPAIKHYMRDFEKYVRRYRLGWALQILLGVSKKRP